MRPRILLSSPFGWLFPHSRFGSHTHGLNITLLRVLEGRLLTSLQLSPSNSTRTQPAWPSWTPSSIALTEGRTYRLCLLSPACTVAGSSLQAGSWGVTGYPLSLPVSRGPPYLLPDIQCLENCVVYFSQFLFFKQESECNP